MHRRPVLPLGVKFDPTDAQLILGYLYPKFHRMTLAWNAIGFSDLVYEKPPWEFCTDLTAFPGDEKHYFFTERKKNHDRVVRTVGSYGTWHESSSKVISKGIGVNKLLNFKVKGEGKEMRNTDWLMHEFSLPDKKINLVLCVIQKKKKKKEKEKEEMGLAYDTNPEFDPNSFLDLDSTTSAYVDPSPGPAPAPALDSEEEETRPSKKMRSDPIFDDDPFSGGVPCPAPAPAPAPAHDNHLELQVLDSKEEETRPSKKRRSGPIFDDDPFFGGVPCPAPAPAPAPAHDNHLELQVLNSEEEETQPSKKMDSDPIFDDDQVPVASSSADLPIEYWIDFATDLLDFSVDEPGLTDVSGLLDDVPGLLDDDFFVLEAPSFIGDS